MCMKRVLCLFNRHDWKFGYNHGIPCGSNLSYKVIRAMFKDGRAYSIDVCTRCGKQSRMVNVVNSRRVILPLSEMEHP